MDDKNHHKRQSLEEMQQIRAVQTEIVTMRTELPKEYVKLLKRDFNTYVGNLESGQCVIPDNLIVNIKDVAELPTINVPQSVIHAQSNEEEEIKSLNDKQKKLSTLLTFKRLLEK